MAAIPHDDDDDDDDVSRIGSLNDDKPQRRNSESYCLGITWEVVTTPAHAQGGAMRQSRNT